MPNRSIGYAPFVAVYGQLPKHVMDISTTSNNKIVEDIVQNSRRIYDQVQSSLSEANEKYKQAVDKSKRHKVFEGEFVMIHLHNDRHPITTYSKLKAKNFGPFEILKKINDNAYVGYLPT